MKICILLLLVISPVFSIYSQTKNNTTKSFRRHFLIALDVSTTFKIPEEKTHLLQNALIQLFSNNGLPSKGISNTSTLNLEKGSGNVFFNPIEDEITFFHFGLADSDVKKLQSLSRNQVESEAIKSFQDFFIKDQHYSWSSYPGAKTIEDYFNSAFKIKPVPETFGGGYTLSYLVYPLLLAKVSQEKYSKEYIIIILSDFLAGSQFGNMRDYDILQGIYSNYNQDALKFIKGFVEVLNSKVYHINYFDYSIDAQYYARTKHTANNYLGVPFSFFSDDLYTRKIGAISYKVKPNAGIIEPEEILLYINSDLNLVQRGYFSDSFKTNDATIKFTHNNNLILKAVMLNVDLINNTQESQIFSDTIALLKDKKWISNYTGSSHLLEKNNYSSDYRIPPLSLPLIPIVKNKKFSSLNFSYSFYTQFPLTIYSSLNYIYTSKRIVAKANVIYSKKSTVIMYSIFIPLLIILITIITVICISRPITFDMDIIGPTQSFMVPINADLKSSEAIVNTILPYKTWKRGTQRYSIGIKGSINYLFPGNFLNWGRFVKVYFDRDVIVPNDFNFHLLKEPDGTNDQKLIAHKGQILRFRQTNNNEISCSLIFNNFTNIEVSEPSIIEFSIRGEIEFDFLGLYKFKKYSERKNYSFIIGPDLGTVWLGIDAGTTGSCFVAGSSFENLTIPQDKRGKDIIYPSILVFDKLDKEKIYVGTNAEPFYGNSDYYSFQSIKKLIGFQDRKRLVFNYGEELQFSGRELSSLLINGLFKDFKEYLESNKDSLSEELLTNDKFEPKRAVVAIPNNFTSSKISDILRCFTYDQLKSFKEVRFIYEAEAVLLYYFCKNRNDEGLLNKNYLIFDFGGATINVSVIHVGLSADSTPTNKEYVFNTLGKLGYGIGGDTIDYCISKFLFNAIKKYPFSSKINPFINLSKSEKNDAHSNRQKELRIAYKNIALSIKKEIIKNFNKSEDLIKWDTLEDILKLNFKDFIDQSSISIKENDQLLKAFSQETHYAFLNLSDPLIKNGSQLELISDIYKNIEEIVTDILQIGKVDLSTIIIAGRSSAFPEVKNKIMDSIKKFSKDQPKIDTIFLENEEAKTAVAKGACWYGVSEGAIQLNNIKTNAIFGMKERTGMGRDDFRFHQLINMGIPFNHSSNSCKNQLPIESDFHLDGHNVNFYQIMGANPMDILTQDERHKFSKIASANISHQTKSIAIEVTKEDNVTCKIYLNDGDEINVDTKVINEDIVDANEEHYTWLVQ